MQNFVYEFLSPQQFCAAALLVTNDTLNVLSETANDVTVLATQHIVEGDSLINLYDPIGECLAEYTTYSNTNGVSIMSIVKQVPGPRIQLPDYTITDMVKLIYDFSDQEIAGLGLYGCLKIARENDPTRTTIVELLQSSIYLPAGYVFTNIVSAIHAMDDAHPTYGYAFAQVYHYDSEYLGLSDGVKAGDFNLSYAEALALYKSSSVDEFLQKVQMTRAQLLSRLIADQYPGFVADTILECVNYRYAKSYHFTRGSDEFDMQIYKMAGDSGRFRTVYEESIEDFFVNQVKEVSEESAAQSVLQKALYLISSGESKVADLASYLGQGFDTTYGSTKNLINTISSYGSSLSTGAASAMKSVYSSMLTATPVSDTTIKWGTLSVPTYDPSMGSCVVGIACTAAQVIGMFALMAGGLIAKAAGALLLAGTYIVKGINSLLTDVADTYPDFKSDSIDRLFGYPLFQNEQISTNSLPISWIEHLKRYNSMKIFFPWCILFLYNYDGISSCSAKVFATVSQTSDDGYGLPCIWTYRALASTYLPTVDLVTHNVDEYTLSGFHYNREHLLEILDYAYHQPEFEDIVTHIKPCTPDHYNVGSKDSQDYKSLWSCIALNASLTLLLFGEYVSLDNDRTITFDTSTNSVGFIQYGDHPEDLFNAVMMYFFGYYYSNVSYSNVLQNEAGLKGADIEFLAGSPDYAEFVVNKFLPWVSEQINSSFHGALFERFISDEHVKNISLELPWCGFDPMYAVTPPRRSLKSLIWAVVLTAAVVIGSIVTFTLIKKTISRKLEPIWFKKVSRLTSEREALQSLEVRTAEDAKAYNEISKQYFKSVRKFNIISRLLGMGTYNVMADWYEGSGTLGGTWVDASSTEGVSSSPGLIESIKSSDLVSESLVDPDTGTVITLKDVIDEGESVKESLSADISRESSATNNKVDSLSRDVADDVLNIRADIEHQTTEVKDSILASKNAVIKKITG